MFKVIAGVAFGMVLAVYAPVAAQDPTVAHGMKVYADQKCAVCHSIGDKGNRKGPLDEVASKLKPEEIREWIVDAKGMTAKTKSSRKPLMRSYNLPWINSPPPRPHGTR